MDSENFWFGALKLFLVFGPLLGFAVLELVLLRRDKRRSAFGAKVPPIAVRPRAGGDAGLSSSVDA